MSDEEKRGDGNPKPKRSVATTRKFSQSEKFWITVLPILGGILLATACFVYGTHQTLSIRMFLASALTYDVFLWILLKGLLRHRTTAAAALALLALIGFGAWDQVGFPPPKPPPPPGPPSLTQLTGPIIQNAAPCAANVVGSGNTVLNCAPAQKGEKKK